MRRRVCTAAASRLGSGDVIPRAPLRPPLVRARVAAVCDLVPCDHVDARQTRERDGDRASRADVLAAISGATRRADLGLARRGVRFAAHPALWFASAPRDTRPHWHGVHLWRGDAAPARRSDNARFYRADLRDDPVGAVSRRKRRPPPLGGGDRGICRRADCCRAGQKRSAADRDSGRADLGTDDRDHQPPAARHGAHRSRRDHRVLVLAALVSPARSRAAAEL